MSIWNRLTGAWNRLTGSEPVGGRRTYYTGRTQAGVYVDADSALKTAAVWACVQYLSKTIAQLPWRVMREGPGGSGGIVVDTNPSDYLLHKRPNPEMGSFTFRQTMMAWALLRGNAYAEIQRDNRGAAYALWPIHPDRVTPRRNANGVLYYQVTGYGDAVDLAAEDMLHIRGFGDGVVGVSVIEYAAQSIGWAQATELFGAGFFGDGMNPSGIIEVQKGLSGPALEELRKEVNRVYGGPKGQRTAILDAGMKFSKLSTQPNDAQFIETMQHQVPEICRWFGVPPHKIMHLLQATFSNIEHQSIEVVVDSITPWCKIWEDEADYKLFGFNRQGLYTKLNLKGLLRGDNQSRMAFYKGMFEISGMSPNDILRAEDMPTIGPDGDARFVPLNMTTLQTAIATAMAALKAAEAPAPAPTAPTEQPAPAPQEEPA